jgi:membrane protein YqaA with SNARE-associated domain
MKSRLRYSPGLGYGILLSVVPWLLLLGFFLKLESWNLPTFLVVIVAVIGLLGVAFAFVLGKDIFNFTKEKYLKRYKDDKTAQHYAELTEGILMLVLVFLATIVLIIGEDKYYSKNSSSVSESINNWD